MSKRSRCTICDKMTDDSELRLDRQGWKRLEPACKKCLLSIKPEQIASELYAPLYDPDTLANEYLSNGGDRDEV